MDPRGPSKQSDSRHGSSAGPSGQSGRLGRPREQFSGPSGRSGPASSVEGSSSKISGLSGPSDRSRGDSRGSTKVPSGTDELRVLVAQQVLQQVHNRTWNSIVSLLVLLNRLQFHQDSSLHGTVQMVI